METLGDGRDEVDCLVGAWESHPSSPADPESEEGLSPSSSMQVRRHSCLCNRRCTRLGTGTGRRVHGDHPRHRRREGTLSASGLPPLPLWSTQGGPSPRVVGLVDLWDRRGLSPSPTLGRNHKGRERPCFPGCSPNTPLVLCTLGQVPVPGSSARERYK